MRKSLWKTAFLVSLGMFLILTALILTFVFTYVGDAATGIIGGAGWPTFRFALSELMKTTIGELYVVVLLVTVVTWIGWRRAFKKDNASDG